MRLQKFATSLSVMVVVISLCLIVLLCIVEANPTVSAPNDTPTNEASLSRRSFKLPQFFDFDWYTKKFNKTYKSVTDFLVRKKIYLGQLMGVFVSLVSYKNGRSSYYLKVNEMSDWLPVEKIDLYTNPRLIKGEKVPESLPDVVGANNSEDQDMIDEDDQQEGFDEDEEHPPLAELADLEDSFEQIVTNADKSPAYKAIAEELLSEQQEGVHQRRKRAVQTRSARRRLSLQQLAVDGSPDFVDKPHRVEVRPKSNNPNYEPPEVTTFGSDQPTSDSPGLLQKWIDYAMSHKSVESFAMRAVKNINLVSWWRLPEEGVSDFRLPHTDERKVNLKIVMSPSEKRGKSKQVRKQTELKKVTHTRLYDAGEIEQEDEGFVDDQAEEIDDGLDKVYVDHRDSGCFLEAKSQGTCGSCYIFGIMSMLEYQHCITTGQLVDFSEQYVLDCGKDRMEMHGCQSGIEHDVILFTNYYGIELKRNFPYLKKEDQCPYPKDVSYSRMGYLRTVKQSLVQVPDNSVDHYLMQVPIHCVIHTPADFSSYGGGVHNPKSSCRPERGHALVIVGMGREDGLEYYLMRNSHSVHFGVFGYYKLAKESRPYCLKPNRFMTISGIYTKEPLISHHNKRYRLNDIQAAYKKKMATLLEEYDVDPLGAEKKGGVVHNEHDRGTN